MLERWMLRAITALLVAIGLASAVRAQGPPQGPPPTVGVPPYGLTTHVVIPPDPAIPNQPRVRFGCWATHNGYGCGSFRSDAVFIFGSCRSFYGEACRKGPASPYPPGYGPAPVGAAGYGPAAYGYPGYGAEKTCNCP
jgi:hypothetical protein